MLYSFVTDIVHRDLKLDNILLSQDVENPDDELNIKVCVSYFVTFAVAIVKLAFQQKKEFSPQILSSNSPLFLKHCGIGHLKKLDCSLI